MAHYQNQYSAPQTDEYGNPRQTDEYGNPIHHTTGTYGAGGFDTTTLQGMRPDAAGHGGEYRHDQQHGLSGMLHRSGSSSSSSSEDDGHGGRRKKGLKEKIKEKIPGVGHKDEQAGSYGNTQGYGATTTLGSTGATTTPGYDSGRTHEKKGVMEKIKEKLPGHH